VKKILSWLALALAAMWLVKNPAGAAADLRQVVHALSTLVSSL
jgi:hypothetical protein